MKKVNFNNKEEIAIILEKVPGRGKSYRAVKAVEGYYNDESGVFVDKEGYLYYHFIDFIQENAYKEKYYIGKISISNGIKAMLGNRIDEFKDEYLKKHQEYLYRNRNNENIICINNTTKKEDRYEDEIIIFRDAVNAILESGSMELTYYADSEWDDEESAVNVDIKKDANQKNEKLEIFNKPPKELVDMVKDYVKGQDDAVISIVTNIYQEYKFKNGKKTNMLLLGPTGVGKTFIFEVISKLLGIPMIVFSVPGLTQSGYVGKDVDSILTQLIVASDGDIQKAQNGIIVLDEIDKIAKDDSRSGGVASEGVQNELLKMIEGDKKLIKIGSPCKEIEFDTSNILFIGSGAFQELTEITKPKMRIGFGAQVEVEVEKPYTDDLVNYGMKREFIGRLPIVVKLNNLTKENLCDIILNSKKSELQRMQSLLNECGISIANLDSFVSKIAEDSIEKKIGARGINSTIANMFNKILYNAFNNIGVYDTLVLGDNILKDPNDYKLLSSREEVKSKKLMKLN